LRPVLIQIGELGIPSYGLLLVIAFIVALFLVRGHAKRVNISPNIIENLAFYLMVGTIVGGRFFFVIFHWGDYSSNILSIFKIWQGGMMFFGSFIGAFILGVLYLKKENISILLLADIISPSIGLGEFFTRIGCFLNGCCFGTPSNLPWGVKFPYDSIAGSSPVGDCVLHPTQLYSSLFGLLLFFFLNNRITRMHYRGEIFAQYLIFGGVFRFGIDFIRYYENRANLLINQIISIALIAIGIIMLIRAYKRGIEDSE